VAPRRRLLNGLALSCLVIMVGATVVALGLASRTPTGPAHRSAGADRRTIGDEPG